VSFVRTEDRGAVAVVTLDRPPANALNVQVFKELSQALQERSDTGSVVIASALPTIFSAGWDLPTVLELDRDSMSEFLERFCDLIRQLFVFGPPLVAALPGHTIAGGLILAAGADERLAADGKGQLGLSEVAMGVPVPRCCLALFDHVIGPRQIERLAATGENVSVSAAHAIGLIDRVVPAESLLEQAVERAGRLAQLPSAAYAAIKQRARLRAIERFDQARRDDPFLELWFAPLARERIRALVEKLRKK
jgi:enoyl-CoA hydratase/carnithine racemase